MAARKRGRQGSTSGTETRRAGRDRSERLRSERPAASCAIADSVVELRLGERVQLDVLVTADGDLHLYLRVDGALLVAIPVLGDA